MFTDLGFFIGSCSLLLAHSGGTHCGKRFIHMQRVPHNLRQGLSFCPRQLECPRHARGEGLIPCNMAHPGFSCCEFAALVLPAPLAGWGVGDRGGSGGLG